jgi:Ser/Thr protein kinase RdoA (MazF antagonist)
VAAAVSTATALDLAVDDAVILNDSNRLVVRLTPCDVVARVTPKSHFASAERELEVVRRLAATDIPVAALEARVEPRVFACDGFEITMWTFIEHAQSPQLPSADYAHALERLYAAMRQIDLATPHFTDRAIATERWVLDRALTPDLTEADRQLLAARLASLSWLIVDGGAPEQLLHGEPHPWNVLRTNNGLFFIDFENCVRGPVEYDLGWVPREVAERYPDVDQGLIDTCRGLVLAIIAAHRWHRDDQHPSGRSSGVAFLDVLREGPPWPAHDVV